MKEPEPKRRNFRSYLEYSQVGLEMVVPIALGVLLDRWLRTLPWFTVGGVVIGFVGGLLHLLRLLKRMDRDNPSTPQDGS